MAGENVIVVSFAEDSSAYEALTKLKELDGQDQISVKGAAIVQRGEDGRIAAKDSVDDNQFLDPPAVADRPFRLYGRRAANVRHHSRSSAARAGDVV